MSVIRHDGQSYEYVEPVLPADVPMISYQVDGRTLTRYATGLEIALTEQLRGAVALLGEVEHILRALDAQYVTLKYLPTTEPRAQVLKALAMIERGECVCMGGTRECVPPFGPNGGCSRSDDQPASDEENLRG